MTTQPLTPAQQAAEQFREEIRAAFAKIETRIDNLSAENDSIRHDLETLISAVGTITTGIQHAATATPPAANPQDFRTMVITTIIKATDDNGKDTFKAQGEPFLKHGVRIWDEVLPLLGIDPATLKYGKNAIEAIPARVLMGETTNPITKEKGFGPRKVTGKA